MIKYYDGQVYRTNSSTILYNINTINIAGSTPETTVCCPIGTAQLPRFGYEPSTQQCHQFIYRGLKGNQNNFLTLEECQLACLPNPCPSGKKFLVGIL
ncbi:unnamed protein product [Meloidogyne enterolobii]|uniref:Uncharacterized protein n=1 Tax=Meloidogyne enterolobii TaxID=390850 RepID=A0ACB0XU63_MELEN